MKQDVTTLLEILEKKKLEIRELKEEIQRQQLHIENIYQENSTKDSIQRILENSQSKLQDNFVGNTGRAEELKEQANTKTQPSNTEAAIQDSTNPQTPLYSDMLIKMVKNPKTTSDSSIRLKNLPCTKMSIIAIRNILNMEIKNNPHLPRIYCETSRSRNTLIMKSVSEDETEDHLKIIESIEKLKDITEITFMTKNQKKL